MFAAELSRSGIVASAFARLFSAALISLDLGKWRVYSPARSLRQQQYEFFRLAGRAANQQGARPLHEHRVVSDSSACRPDHLCGVCAPFGGGMASGATGT